MPNNGVSGLKAQFFFVFQVAGDRRLASHVK
jgi:hypothetical protein